MKQCKKYPFYPEMRLRAKTARTFDSLVTNSEKLICSESHVNIVKFVLPVYCL